MTDRAPTFPPYQPPPVTVETIEGEQYRIVKLPKHDGYEFHKLGTKKHKVVAGPHVCNCQARKYGNRRCRHVKHVMVMRSRERKEAQENECIAHW